MKDQGNERMIATFEWGSGLRDARDLLMASGFADTDIHCVNMDRPMEVTCMGEDFSMIDRACQRQHPALFAQPSVLDDDSSHKESDLGISDEDVGFDEDAPPIVGQSNTGRWLLSVDVRERGSEAERIIRRAGGTVDVKVTE